MKTVRPQGRTPWRYSTDRSWVRLESGVWVEDKTILYPISEICAEVGRPFRALGAQQAQIDIMLNGSRKHQTVELAMRNDPNFVARKEDFDADPWKLNTPVACWTCGTARSSHMARYPACRRW